MQKFIKIFLLLLSFLILVVVGWEGSLPKDQVMITHALGDAYVLRSSQPIKYRSTEDQEDQKDSTGAVWSPVTSGMKVHSGAILRTGPLKNRENKGVMVRGSLDVLSDSGVAFRIKGSSLIQLEKRLVKSKKGKENQKIDVNLMFGTLLGKVTTPKSIRGIGEELVHIRTPTAAVGIRGTIYKVGYYPSSLAHPEANQSTITVSKGVVQVSSLLNPKLKQRIHRGQKVLAQNNYLIRRRMNRRDYEELRETVTLKENLDFIDTMVELFDMEQDTNLLSRFGQFIQDMNKKTQERMDYLKEILQNISSKK